MKSYVRESIEAERDRQRADERERLIIAAAKRLGLHQLSDETDGEFYGRVPALERGMAAYNDAAARFADDLDALQGKDAVNG